MVSSRYLMGKDGRTAWQRWKGKRFKRDVPEFGERVMYFKSGTKKGQPYHVRGSLFGSNGQIRGINNRN